MPDTGDSKVIGVHRAVYVVKTGTMNLPRNGQEVSDLCGQSRLCCNPDHLTFEPHHVNNSRSRQQCHGEGRCLGHGDLDDCLFMVR